MTDFLRHFPDNSIRGTGHPTSEKTPYPQKVDAELHGPTMIAIKAKIYGVLYKQSSSIALMKHLVIG